MVLNQKQDTFCKEYLKCGNATKAAILAGYSKKTAYSIGARLLKNVEIQTRLDELREDLAGTIGVSRERIANELSKIAFSNISDSRTSWMTLKDFKKLTDDQKAAIAEVCHETRGAGRTAIKMVKIKLHSKLSAIEELNKMLGFNAPQKVEFTGKNGKPIQQEVKHVVEFNDYTDANH